jgi:hypothetical protein
MKCSIRKCEKEAIAKIKFIDHTFFVCDDHRKSTWDIMHEATIASLNLANDTQEKILNQDGNDSVQMPEV